jgi:hypothetical protein
MNKRKTANKAAQALALLTFAGCSLGAGFHYPGPEKYLADRAETCTEQLNAAGYWVTDNGPVNRAYADDAAEEYWQILNNCNPDKMTDQQYIESWAYLHGKNSNE